MRKFPIAVLAAMVAASFAGTSFAQGKSGGSAGVGVGAGAGAGANVTAPNPSASGQANANGQFQTERTFGLDRAQDRMSEQGKAHEKATSQEQAKRKGQQPEATGSVETEVKAQAKKVE